METSFIAAPDPQKVTSPSSAAVPDPQEVTSPSSAAVPQDVTPPSSAAVPQDVTPPSSAAVPQDVTPPSSAAVPQEVTPPSSAAVPQDVTPPSSAAVPQEVTHPSSAVVSDPVLKTQNTVDTNEILNTEAVTQERVASFISSQIFHDFLHDWCDVRRIATKLHSLGAISRDELDNMGPLAELRKANSSLYLSLARDSNVIRLQLVSKALQFDALHENHQILAKRINKFVRGTYIFNQYITTLKKVSTTIVLVLYSCTWRSFTLCDEKCNN